MQEKDFYLYIDGQPVPVSREVYREYYRAEDKERYFMGKLKKGIQKSTRKHRKYNTSPAGNCPMSSLRSRTGSLPHPAIPWRTGWSEPQ